MTETTTERPTLAGRRQLSPDDVRALDAVTRLHRQNASGKHIEAYCNPCADAFAAIGVYRDTPMPEVATTVGTSRHCPVEFTEHERHHYHYVFTAEGEGTPTTGYALCPGWPL